MSERDYLGEMTALVIAATQGPYVAPVVAAEIVDKLLIQDPELLAGWLHDQAAELLAGMIRRRDQSIRAHARVDCPRSVFAKAVAEHEKATKVGVKNEALTNWMQVHYTLSTNVRMPLRMMNKDHLLDVSGQYRRRADENRMHSVFLAALATKVKDGTVADHFTEERIAEMWTSLSTL